MGLSYLVLEESRFQGSKKPPRFNTYNVKDKDEADTLIRTLRSLQSDHPQVEGMEYKYHIAPNFERLSDPLINIVSHMSFDILKNMGIDSRKDPDEANRIRINLIELGMEIKEAGRSDNGRFFKDSGEPYINRGKSEIAFSDEEIEQLYRYVRLTQGPEEIDPPNVVPGTIYCMGGNDICVRIIDDNRCEVSGDMFSNTCIGTYELKDDLMKYEEERYKDMYGTLLVSDIDMKHSEASNYYGKDLRPFGTWIEIPIPKPGKKNFYSMWETKLP